MNLYDVLECLDIFLNMGKHNRITISLACKILPKNDECGTRILISKSSTQQAIRELTENSPMIDCLLAGIMCVVTTFSANNTP